MPKYVVRHGAMRHLGVFSARARDSYARGARVVARTFRGEELGEVLCEATEHVLAQMGDEPKTGRILRQETAEDVELVRRGADDQERAFVTVRHRIEESGLDMKLVDVERLHNGDRYTVFYLAEERIDFRELVKTLGADLGARIEMRQIGVRDEAKLLADYGDCGKPVCCNTHLSAMPPVSMKMAKLQKATLDPTKISGRCGRLKCCLRYEYDTYQELKRELPKVGHDVLTSDGRARVLSQEILTSELLVQTEAGRRIVIPASDVLTVLGKSAPPPNEAEKLDGGAEQGRGRREKPQRPRGERPPRRQETRSSGGSAEAKPADAPPAGARPEDGPGEGGKPKRRRRRGKRRPPGDGGSGPTDRPGQPPAS
ncbi:MAG: regulatory iron-sulfur-containing complex subunit RicT [Planctomycetota bacterium]